MSKKNEVSILRRFQRSVRIDSDMYTAGSLDGYIPVESVVGALKRLVEQFANSPQRAFTWTGPYGGGKSSLALLLSALVNPNNPNASALPHVLSKADL